MGLISKKEDGWYLFDCCSRCSIDNCTGEYIPFSEEDSKILEDSGLSEEAVAKVYSYRLSRDNTILKLILPKTDWEEEMKKCCASPYYFYTNYVTIEGPEGSKKATTSMLEEEFNKFFKQYAKEETIWKTKK